MAIAALNDSAYYEDIRARIICNREKLRERLNQIEGITAFESDANFIYIRTVGYDAEKICSIVKERGYLIRVFNGNNEKHLRITIGTEEMMEELTEFLLDAISNSRI